MFGICKIILVDSIILSRFAIKSFSDLMDSSTMISKKHYHDLKYIFLDFKNVFFFLIS